MIIKNAAVRSRVAEKKSIIVSSFQHHADPAHMSMSGTGFSRDIIWRNEQQNCCKAEVIILKASDRLKGKKYCD